MSAITKLFACALDANDTVLQGNIKDMMNDAVPIWMSTLEYRPWFGAILGAVVVALSGVLPILIIPIDHKNSLKEGAGANSLKSLLSFAVGGILGDVFLHSLPEIYANDLSTNGGKPVTSSGLLVLSGLIIFLAIEKFFTVIEKLKEETKLEDNNNMTKINKKHITGYLNLLSNTIDNFTHGLSLGGAFLVSFELGLFTLFAILLHEIPHEVGDFAILLKSGFSRFEAAICQLLTSGGGLVGSLAAIVFSGASTSLEARSSWIMPFTAGTFLHIALVTVLPDLLKEEDPKESFKQVLALIMGICIMASVTSYVHE